MKLTLWAESELNLSNSFTGVTFDANPSNQNTNQNSKMNSLNKAIDEQKETVLEGNATIAAVNNIGVLYIESDDENWNDE